MNETELFNLRVLLKQMVITVQMLAEETAELVDKFHSPSLTAAGRQDLYERRVHGLTEAARSMTEAAHKALDKTGQSEPEEWRP